MYKNKKIALCIVGFTRDFNKTLTTLVKNILNNNVNKKILFDLYLVTYEKMFDKKIEEILTPYCNNIIIHLLKESDYSHDKENINNSIFKNHQSLNKKLFDIEKRNPRTYHIMTKCFLPQFHHMLILKRMIEDSNEKYDIIVKTRYDVLYEEPIDINCFFAQYINTSIVMPDKNFAYRYEEIDDNLKTKRTLKNTEYGKINDVFLLSNHTNMLNYFNAINTTFKEISKLDLDKNESYVGYHIYKKLKLSTVHLSNKMGLYRKMSERLDMDMLK